jgi:tryptophan-rich sensory protein
VIKPIISFALTFLTALIGSSVTTPSIAGWYQTINKAPFNPPNWLFAPAWTILFILMAISLYLVWKKSQFPKIFLLQLFLNFFWSFSFFYLHQPILAYIDILVLIVVLIFTIKQFIKIDKLAAYLLYPYLAWISFASILNLYVIILN